MYIEKFVDVTDILYEDNEIQLLATSGGAKKAMLYKSMLPAAATRDTLHVNHTAVALSLGTGGWDIVTAVVGKEAFQQKNHEGHIMKARYLPSQQAVLAVESQESEQHHLFLDGFSLKNRPVMLAELHSMIPIVYSVIKAAAQHASLTIIISDEASIPLHMSEHLRLLKKENHVQTISIGQAFGGDIEAVNLQTALQYASAMKSDYILVTLGPGVVGTGTKYGFSGMALADWANIVGKLGGRPVWIPRLSFSDKRNRHGGISHHTLTPLLEFTYAACYLPLPLLDDDKQQFLAEQTETILHTNHQIKFVPLDQWALEKWKEEIKRYPIAIKTMGRTMEDDPSFFYGVFAAVMWVIENREENGGEHVE